MYTTALANINLLALKTYTLAAEKIDFGELDKVEATGFFEQGLGAMILSVSRFVGIIALFIGAVIAVKSFISGRVSQGMKAAVGTMIAVTFLFFPMLLIDLSEGMAGLVKALVETITGLFSSGAGG